MQRADLAKPYEREEPTKKYIDMPTKTVREPNVNRSHFGSRVCAYLRATGSRLVPSARHYHHLLRTDSEGTTWGVVIKTLITIRGLAPPC